MTGYLAEELIGQSPIILAGPKTGRNGLSRLRTRLARGESFSGEMICYRKDGSECAVELLASPIRDHRGEITHFVSTLRDINRDGAEKKRFETMVMRASRMESVGALASAMAHDLNNILAPILMTLSALRERLTDESSRRGLSLMHKSAERGKDLIERVLAFARDAEGERAPLHTSFQTPFQTFDLLSDMAMLLKETLPNSIELQVRAPDNLWSVAGDSTQIHRALLNLCINARDAMPSGGKLTIKARNRYLVEEEVRLAPNPARKRYVRITVTDTGAGIPREIIDHVFDPFFTTKERGQGSGLGLSIVLAMVRAHEGFINFFSKTGWGTEFKVYLPAEP